MLKRENSPAYVYFSEIEKELDKHFQISPSDRVKVEFRYGMTLYYLANLEFNIDAQNPFLKQFDFSFFDKARTFHEDILSDIRKIIRKSPLRHNVHSNESVATLVILNYIAASPSKKLYLCINYTHSLIASPHIRARITAFFNEEIIEFTDELDEADVIITDAMVFQEVKGDIFYFNVLTDDTQWESLLKFINKKLFYINF